MRELVIVLSDLYFASGAADAGMKLTGLERVTRFGAASALPGGWRSWLAAWLGGPALSVASPAAVAAAAILPGTETSEWVWIADPVHLQAGLTTVHLAPQGLLRLDAPSQAQLSSAFNSEFADTRFRLAPTRSGRFLAAGPAMPGAAERTDPARWLGSSLADVLAPAGAPGALRRLSGEIEMWLHEHPLNARRAREGRLPVSALWLWGGGPPLPARASGQEGRSVAGPGERATVGPGARVAASPAERAVGRHSTVFFGDDPFVEGLAHVIRASCAPAARGLADVAVAATAAHAERIVAHLELFSADTGSAASGSEASGSEASGSEASGVGGQGLRGTPASPLQALAAFDREWIEPALEQLDRRAISRLAVIANDRQVSLSARDFWKRWRPRRAALAALAAP